MKHWFVPAVASIVACQFERPPDVTGGIDAVSTCGSDGDCRLTPDTPFCDPVMHACVACSDSLQCVGLAGGADICLLQVGSAYGDCVVCDDDGRQAPDVGAGSDECFAAGAQVCDSATHDCRECRANTECTSGLCDEGDCVAVATIAYVAAAGTATTGCTQSDPCATVVQALGTGRSDVLVGPGSFDTTAGVEINNRTVAIHGAGATFSRSTPGSILTVRGSSEVVVVGGTFDATGDGPDDAAIITTGTTSVTLDGVTVRNSSSDGIAAAGNLRVLGAQILSNMGDGIEMNSLVNTFELTRSTIRRNGRSGVSVYARTATVVNNFVVKNGAEASVSSLRVAGLGNPSGSRIEFNTIAGNVADASTNGGGVSCASSTFVLRNSIIFGNLGNSQVDSCTLAFSSVEGATPNPAIGLINDPPGFISTGADNFGLMSGSAVAGKADPAADLTGPAAVDFDGQMRPLGGTVADLGADEIP